MLLVGAMRRRSTAFKTVVGLWLALVITATGTPGMVLCIGEDGHLSVEPAHNGHCHDCPDDAAHGESTSPPLADAPDIDDCGDCIDLSLASDRLTRREADHGFDGQSQLLCTPTALGLADAASVSARRSPRPDATLRLCRSVVLRI